MGRQHHYVFLKIQGFTNNVVVFTHELVRCATHEWLRKLNIQNADFDSENFILQEWNHRFWNQHPRKHGIQKKSPVYLKGEAVQSRNHSSVTTKFKFIKKLKRLPFGNRLTDFVPIFFVDCYFWSSFKWTHFHHILWGWVNKGVQLSMEWPHS